MAGPVEAEAAAESRAQREVAQRVFAAEFNEAKHSYKESGDRSPSFVVSPHGARVNRLFAVGVLTSVEAVGQSGDRYRAAVVDPTGTFTLFAGQYEPEATAQLLEIKPPAVVAVVGKSRSYTTEEGATYVNVRPESIRAVERADRDAWILETARLTLQRLDAAREASAMAAPTAKTLIDAGYPTDVAEGVIKALEHYKTLDVDRATTLVRDALESLLPGSVPRTPEPPVGQAQAQGQAHATAPAMPKATPKAAVPAESPHEPLILSLAQKLDDGKGAPWEDIVAEASKKGVTETQVEECLNALMDKGQVYEPVLGRIKRT